MRAEVELHHPMIPVSRQCDLLDLSRSSFYYLPRGEDEENLMLMRRIDEQFTKTPYFGVSRMTAWLKARGYIVNLKRVRVLIRRMELQAIFPHKRRSFSLPGFNNKVYFFATTRRG
jgi:putative transposase